MGVLQILYLPFKRASILIYLALIGCNQYKSQKVITILNISQLPHLGGLSAVEVKGDMIYALSDDRGSKGPVRIYKFLRPKTFSDSISPIGIIVLKDKDGKPFTKGRVDPEGLVIFEESIVVTSEGTKFGKPWIREFDFEGNFIREFSYPSYYLPSKQKKGIRPNMGWEAVDYINNTLILFTEGNLYQDKPDLSTLNGSPSRVLFIDYKSGIPVKEHIYLTEPISIQHFGKNFVSVRGVTSAIALTETHFLVLEREFTTRYGFKNSIFLAYTNNATDVLGLESIESEKVTPMKKKLLVDLNSLPIPRDNYEGMFISDKYLYLITDDNFSPLQQNLLVRLKLPKEVRKIIAKSDSREFR